MKCHISTSIVLSILLLTACNSDAGKSPTIPNPTTPPGNNLVVRGDTDYNQSIQLEMNLPNRILHEGMFTANSRNAQNMPPLCASNPYKCAFLEDFQDDQDTGYFGKRIVGMPIVTNYKATTFHELFKAYDRYSGGNNCLTNTKNILPDQSNVCEIVGPWNRIKTYAHLNDSNQSDVRLVTMFSIAPGNAANEPTDDYKMVSYEIVANPHELPAIKTYSLAPFRILKQDQNISWTTRDIDAMAFLMSDEDAITDWKNEYFEFLQGDFYQPAIFNREHFHLSVGWSYMPTEEATPLFDSEVKIMMTSCAQEIGDFYVDDKPVRHDSDFIYEYEASYTALQFIEDFGKENCNFIIRETYMPPFDFQRVTPRSKTQDSVIRFGN